jgi:osmotically-inducible protein OsmY
MRSCSKARSDNWDEKFAVENAAWSASGVKNVKDRLTIAS